MDKEIPYLPFSFYQGGKLAYLLNEPFTRDLWNFLSDKNILIA